MPSPTKSVLIALMLLAGIALVAAPLPAAAFVAPDFIAAISNLAPISSHAADFALATMVAVPAAAEVELVGAYTIPEFSRMFKISRGMVYKLEKTGRLKFGKIGNRTIITITEARRFQRALESSDVA
jgi:hypothetical protein